MPHLEGTESVFSGTRLPTLRRSTDFHSEDIFSSAKFSFPTQPEAFPDSTGIEEDEPGAIFERFEIFAASRRLQMMSERKERERKKERRRESEKKRKRESVCARERE